MKVVLQKKGSLQYLQDEGNWTPRVESARIFPNTLNALNFCQAKQLSGIQIRLKFGDNPSDDSSDIVLPLPQNMGILTYDTQRVRTFEG